MGDGVAGIQRPARTQPTGARAAGASIVSSPSLTGYGPSVRSASTLISARPSLRQRSEQAGAPDGPRRVGGGDGDDVDQIEAEGQELGQVLEVGENGPVDVEHVEVGRGRLGAVPLVEEAAGLPEPEVGPRVAHVEDDPAVNGITELRDRFVVRTEHAARPPEGVGEDVAGAQRAEEGGGRGLDAEQLRQRIEAVAPLPESLTRVLAQASVVVGRGTFTPAAGFLWIEDTNVRELLRTRRSTAELFVDPSPPAGLILAAGADLDRLVRRARTVGVDIIVDGQVARCRWAARFPAGRARRRAGRPRNNPRP